MPRKPNYAFERKQRAQAKAAKREAKRQAKRASREGNKTEPADEAPATSVPGATEEE